MLFIGVVLFLPLVSADAFYFTGYTYNSSNAILNGTNVSVAVYDSTHTNVATFSTLVNNVSHGFFNLTIPANFAGNAFNYQPLLRHYNNSYDVDYVGKTLPDFPYQEFSTLNAVKFYLKSGITVNLTAHNASGGLVAFNYMVKDVSLGYPIYSEWTTRVKNVSLALPLDKNYSVMLFPDQSFPIGYDLSSFTTNSTYQNVTHNPDHLDLRFNTSSILRRVSGNATIDGVSGGFQSFKMVNYLFETGNMVFQDHPMPYNMSAWNCPLGVCESDVFNNNTGFYNITLPGADMGANIMMLAVAVKNGVYYGALRNLTLGYSTDSVVSFNFSLQPLPGDLASITVDDGNNPGGNVNITTKKVSFRIQNSSGTAASNGHIEVDVTYSKAYTGGPNLTWVSDLGPTSGGLVSFPLVNYSVKKMNIYASDFAPKRLTFTYSQIAANATTVNLSTFDPGEIDAGEAIADTGLEVGMFLSSASCSVPYPGTSCALFNATQFDQFNPLTTVIGGGKIDFMMRIKSNNVTVKYVNVDLIASGPPDAAFDSDSQDSQGGSSLEEAWRFGSQGPTIYDYVWIGMPYSSTVDESAPIKVLLENLYDENWNSVWNSSTNSHGENFSTVADGDYADFNQSWLNATVGGMGCSLTDQTQDCYVNTTLNMIWLKLPHFSGLGPAVSTTTTANVTVNTTTDTVSCTNNCTIYINVSNGNFTIYETLQNITINNSNTRDNILNYTIYKYNETDWALNGTNGTTHTRYNFTIANGSDKNLHRYKMVIFKSNTSTTLWNFTYNYTINSSAFSIAQTLVINLTCGESWTCTDWATCSADTGTQTRTCSDGNACGTYSDRPSLTQGCNAPSSSTGGGGAGGAGGGVAAGVTGNYAKEIWESINAGESAAVEVPNGVIGVTEVAFAVTKTTYGAWVKVEKISSLPEDLNDFTGKLYKSIKITENNVEKVLKDKAVIKFKVEKSWLSGNELSKEAIALFRYENGWNPLSTKIEKEDDSFVYYQSEAPGFSYFVIGQKSLAAVPETAVKEEAVPTEVTGETVKEAAVREEQKEQKKSIWPYVLLGIVIVGILAAVYLSRISRRKYKR